VTHPVVHFEIIGTDADSLRTYYSDLFGWTYDTSSPVSDAISDPTNYGFIQPLESDAGGIPGGIGGGASYSPAQIFYVAVDDVEAALQRAESLGGTRLLGPAGSPNGLVIGHFTDPEGNRIGVAALP
jgi:uncharacterized protein